MEKCHHAPPNIFASIDANAESGLEAMLDAIANTARIEDDFHTAIRARLEMEKVRQSCQAEDPRIASLHKELERDAGQLREAQGRHYEAANHYFNAGMFEKVIEMDLKSGTPDSLNSAIFYMIEFKVDVERGIRMLCDNGDYAAAIRALSTPENRSTFIRPNREDNFQRTADTLIKGMYQSMLKKAKENLIFYGETPSDTQSLKELRWSGLTDIDSAENSADFVHNLGIDSTDYDHGFVNVSMWIDTSTDKEILQIGLELNDLLRHEHKADPSSPYYKDRQMLLRGRLGETKTAINYFYSCIEDSSTKGNDRTSCINSLTTLLCGDGRIDEAIQAVKEHTVMEGCRPDILKRLYHQKGDLQSLAELHKTHNNPIAYAQVLDMIRKKAMDGQR